MNAMCGNKKAMLNLQNTTHLFGYETVLSELVPMFAYDGPALLCPLTSHMQRNPNHLKLRRFYVALSLRPKKIKRQFKSFNFFVLEIWVSDPRTGPIGFVSEFCVYVRVFMCPEPRYGPGSAKNRFWNTPSLQKFWSMLESCWVHDVDQESPSTTPEFSTHKYPKCRRFPGRIQCDQSQDLIPVLLG